jgi:Late competence development protein ComFB
MFWAFFFKDEKLSIREMGQGEKMYQANSYKNVMELLIDNEIDRQTCSYSQTDAQSVNRIEVATYALNRVPPLYASSQEGIGLQYERGLKEFSDRITAAVSQALSKVLQNPISNSTPLPRLEEVVETEITFSEEDLQEISTWF